MLYGYRLFTLTLPLPFGDEADVIARWLRVAGTSVTSGGSRGRTASIFFTEYLKYFVKYFGGIFSFFL